VRAVPVHTGDLVSAKTGVVGAVTKDLISAYDDVGAETSPFVAVLDGLSLGGGSELALCADTIVGTDRGTIGFPETGIGIYYDTAGRENFYVFPWTNS